MAASTFALLGSYSAATDPSQAGAADIPAVLDERISLSKKHYDELELTADAFTSIAFGGVTNAHVVVVKVPGGSATLRLTSAAGTQQLIPVSELFISLSAEVPYTAIDVQRPTGVSTTVQAFIGEKA